MWDKTQNNVTPIGTSTGE